MKPGLLLPFAVDFLARDYAPQHRFCYWNKRGRRRLHDALLGSVSLPAYWAHQCTRGMLK